MRQRFELLGGAGEVLVLAERVSLLVGPESLDEARSRLPLARQKKVDSLLFERDKLLSVGAWLLLGRAFGMEGLCLSDYPIECAPRGKPYALGCPLRFSISHSGEYAMCAVSRAGEVGCDIQRLDAYDADLARACMTPRELRRIETLDLASQRARAFCRHWVAKESYVKALGCGLAKDPASFSVETCGAEGPDLPGRFRVLDDAPARGTDVFEVRVPEGYCAAACVVDFQG